MAHYIGDPKYDPLFWLCVPIILVYLAAKAVWTRFKTLLPCTPTPVRHCQSCGWTLAPMNTTILCHRCSVAVRQAEEPVSKLFCCDIDLTLLASWTRILPGWQRTTTDRYRCPICARIWLYITEQHKDSGSASDWYPQQTEPWTPRPDEKRTRTKVY
jgi:hypothetical protein